MLVSEVPASCVFFPTVLRIKVPLSLHVPSGGLQCHLCGQVEARKQSVLARSGEIWHYLFVAYVYKAV